MSNRVQEILSWYESDNAGTKTNIARLLNSGKLAGTGKLVILPVDQGFEHGPARSFAPNPPGITRITIFSWRSMPAATPTLLRSDSLEAGAGHFAGRIPLILKLNNHDVAP